MPLALLIVEQAVESPSELLSTPELLFVCNHWLVVNVGQDPAL